MVRPPMEAVVESLGTIRLILQEGLAMEQGARTREIVCERKREIESEGGRREREREREGESTGVPRS